MFKFCKYFTFKILIFFLLIIEFSSASTLCGYTSLLLDDHKRFSHYCIKNNSFNWEAISVNTSPQHTQTIAEILKQHLSDPKTGSTFLRNEKFIKKWQNDNKNRPFYRSMIVKKTEKEGDDNTINPLALIDIKKESKKQQNFDTIRVRVLLSRDLEDNKSGILKDIIKKIIQFIYNVPVYQAAVLDKTDKDKSIISVTTYNLLYDPLYKFSNYKKVRSLIFDDVSSDALLDILNKLGFKLEKDNNKNNFYMNT